MISSSYDTVSLACFKFYWVYCSSILCAVEQVLKKHISLELVSSQTELVSSIYLEGRQGPRKEALVGLFVFLFKILLS